MAASARRGDVSDVSQLSLSCAIRKAVSATVLPTTEARTGAENCRRNDSAGASPPQPGAGSTKLCRGSVSWSTSVPASSTSAPLLGCSRPTAQGMRNGRFIACPGVGPHACVSVRVTSCLPASNSISAVTVGVPACRYHSSNCAGNPPGGFASDIAARKSSHVAAVPSCLAK